jgi:adenylate kinase
MLRRNVAEGTKIGRAAASYLNRGDLVPDELVIEMLAGPVLEAVAKGGFVLDGFPRTLRQAKEARELARQLGDFELSAVIRLLVGRDELHRRLVGRAVQEGRSDDTDAVIAHRLEVFDTETAPMLEFYEQRGLVLTVNGEQTVERVFADIVRAVDALGAARKTGVSE